MTTMYRFNDHCQFQPHHVKFTSYDTDLQGRAEVNNVAPSRRKPSSQYDAPVGSSEEDNDDLKLSEDEADSSDANTAETAKVHQVIN